MSKFMFRTLVVSLFAASISICALSSIGFVIVLREVFV